MRTFATTGEMGSQPGPIVDPARLLGLAATPILAVMAGISATSPSGMTICSAISAMAPIDDMALMYLLMSLFHLSPWLKLLSAIWQRRDTPIPQTEGD